MTMYTIKLVGAASFETHGIKFKKNGKSITCPEGHPHLPFYVSKSKGSRRLFDVRVTGSGPRGVSVRPAKAGLTKAQKKAAKKAKKAAKKAAETVGATEAMAPEMPKTEEPPKEAERRVFTADRSFTESQLAELKKTELLTLAEELEVELGPRDNKGVIVEKLLAQE